MKPVLKTSFYLVIKNKSNRLISMVDMIEPLFSTLPPPPVTLGDFCDCLENVILSFDLL